MLDYTSLIYLKYDLTNYAMYVNLGSYDTINEIVELNWYKKTNNPRFFVVSVDNFNPCTTQLTNWQDEEKMKKNKRNFDIDKIHFIFNFSLCN